MGSLEGRIAVITGAGRGIGRNHALLFAREGAKVVVNDLGSTPDGDGADVSAAQAVVDEIKALGGEAVANTDNVADWDGAKRLIDTAVEAFGDLHCLVNNAGIVRRLGLLECDGSDWDMVMDVHLKGTFCPTRHAVAYWREQKKAGESVNASVVCTSSASGLTNSGPSNYATAKAGVAAFALTIAKEVARYGVRVNAIAPVARTRLTESSGAATLLRPPEQAGAFDRSDPSNISPLVGYLSTADCAYTGSVWHVWGGEVGLCEGWRVVERAEHNDQWTIEELAKEIPVIVGDRALEEGRLISEGQTTLDLLQVKLEELTS